MNDNMNEKECLNLGSRLKSIADLIPAGSLLGDIGTDHAYLPVYLLQQGRITRAIGVDIHKGPFLSAKKTVSEYKLNDKIEIRFGDGLKPLAPGEVDTLSIAGMGGTTILEILKNMPEVLAGIKDMILQPQGAEAKVRQELIAQGWKIVDENLVVEDGRIYMVIHFNRHKGISSEEVKAKINSWADKLKSCTIHNLKMNEGNKESQENQDIKNDWEEYIKILSGFVWMFGPIVLEKKEAILKVLIEDYLDNTIKIIEEMKKTDRENVKQKISRMLKEKEVLEVVKTWVLQLD